MTARSLFITGTDTGVGKTLAAAALLDILARRGQRVAGMKPVSSGSAMTNEGLRNEDALTLMAHATAPADYALVNPYCFAPAIAPHIAAAQAGVRIELDVLQKAHARLSALADRTVVEGAGGWFTPLNERDTLADFARTIGADIVLVVGMRLGCINHALLTTAAIEQAGLKMAGWIANVIDSSMQCLPENLQFLTGRLAAPRLGIIPYIDGLTPGQAAAHLSKELPW